MAYVVNCECGATVSAQDEDTLVSQVQEHVASAHPDLVGKMSRDDIIAMAEKS